MRYSKGLYLLLLWSSWIQESRAQSNAISWASMNSGFGTVKSASNKISFSVGQPFVGNGANTSTAVSSGFLARPNVVTSVERDNISIPLSFSLTQNYPNPFNPSTTIRYGLPQRANVSLMVYNALGQQVATLIQGDQDAGYHDVRFDGLNLASGVYFYRIHAGDFIQTKKLLLLK